MDKNRIDSCVESLCEKGCAEVLEAIRNLEQKHTIAETRELSEEEIAIVLVELTNIMAIYQG